MTAVQEGKIFWPSWWVITHSLDQQVKLINEGLPEHLAAENMEEGPNIDGKWVQIVYEFVSSPFACSYTFKQTFYGASTVA